MTVEDAMKKWKNLRDYFVRENKKVKKRLSGSKGPPYVSRWPLFDIMSFITDSVRHRE